jgi:hypothetical protein
MAVLQKKQGERQEKRARPEWAALEETSMCGMRVRSGEAQKRPWEAIAAVETTPVAR